MYFVKLLLVGPTFAQKDARWCRNTSKLCPPLGVGVWRTDWEGLPEVQARTMLNVEEGAFYGCDWDDGTTPNAKSSAAP